MWLRKCGVAFMQQNKLQFARVYVDEVQDTTQVEIALLSMLCSTPENLFLTGDTAQTVIKGANFRFDDVRKVVHHLKAQKIIKGAQMNKAAFLSHNYRSHTGILDVARALVTTLDRFFPNSIDAAKGGAGGGRRAAHSGAPVV